MPANNHALLGLATIPLEKHSSSFLFSSPGSNFDCHIPGEGALEPHQNSAGRGRPVSWPPSPGEKSNNKPVCPARQEDRPGCGDPVPGESEQSCVWLKGDIYFPPRAL